MKLKGIILAQPKYECNIGGIARTMACFGVENLIIVHPTKRFNLKKLLAAAVQGKKVIMNIAYVDRLEDVRGIKVAAISRFDNEKYCFDLWEVSEGRWPDEFYLVLGRENTGLTQEQMEHCEYHVTIDTGWRYGVLNLCTATSILIHAIHKEGLRRALIVEECASALH